MEGGGQDDCYITLFALMISRLHNILNPDHHPLLQNPNPHPNIQCPDPDIPNPDHDDPPLQSPNPNPDIQNPNDDQSSSEPRLPAEFRASLASMGADNATLIFTRDLYGSDVDKGLNRLAIPRTQIKEKFLRDDEEELLTQKDEDGKVKKLRVRVVDPKRNEWCLTLSRWNYHKSKKSGEGSWSYALNGGWIDLANKNGMKKGTHIQVWSFRVNGSLGFVIDVKDDGMISDQASTSTAIASNNSSSGNGSTDEITILPSWGRKRKRGSNRCTSPN